MNTAGHDVASQNPILRETIVPVPHLAESLVAATVSRWHVQPGDRVAQYDILCELITEKVTTDMPSPFAGVVSALCVAAGEEAAVGQPLCRLIPEGLSKPVRDSSLAEAEPPTIDGDDREQVETEPHAHLRYSPAVLHLAMKHHIRLDDKRLTGSGLDGRITKKDVLAFISQYGSQDEATPPAARILTDPTVRTTGIHLSQEPRIPKIEVESSGKNEYFIDVTPIRNMIASRMRQSVSEIPHAWTMIEVDVTHLVALRNRLKDEFLRREGINLTYLSFMIKAVVSAIKDYPIMNAVWAVDKIIVKRDINLSLAVGTEDSVATPVIKQADRKNIAGIAKEIDELARKTRTGKLTLDDLSGGTFTVNNTGSFGSIVSQPIINYPQAAIVTFESIVKRPVVIQDMIAVRSMVNICLSLDHRILDGVICGRFLQRVKENLEAYQETTNVY